MIRSLGGSDSAVHANQPMYGAVSDVGFEPSGRVDDAYRYHDSFGGVPKEGAKKSKDPWKRFAVWTEKKISSFAAGRASSQATTPGQPPDTEMGQQDACDKDDASVESSDDYCHGFGKCTCVAVVTAVVVVAAMVVIGVEASQENAP
jgi:hypothetical protein